MKLKTFRNLKVGDKVTVRTVEEMSELKGVEVGEDVWLPDSKTRGIFFSLRTEHDEYMSNFCGNTYTISKVSNTHVLFEGDAHEWKFSRKMLRNEVIKNEADSNL